MHSRSKKLNSLNRCLLVIATLLIVSIAHATPRLHEAKVTRVIDGDTVEILMAGKKESIRLIGVDTPETKHPTKGVQPYGPEASAFTKKNLDGKTVWVEFDVQERDKYQRLLGYIWTSQDTKNKANMFNYRLVSEGYAQLATFPPNVRYVELFKAGQTEARENNRGLWGLKQPSPTTPKAPSKKAFYVGNANSKIFHTPDCTAGRKIKAKNAVRFKSREDAVSKGFKPCGVCKP